MLDSMATGPGRKAPVRWPTELGKTGDNTGEVIWLWGYWRTNIAGSAFANTTTSRATALDAGDLLPHPSAARIGSKCYPSIPLISPWLALPDHECTQRVRAGSFHYSASGSPSERRRCCPALSADIGPA